MKWDDLEQDIIARTRAIWMEPPQDLRRLRLGIVDSGAGSYGQVFTTLLYVQSELRGVGINACQALLVCAQQECFGLEQLRIAARAHLSGRTGLLNYLGLHEMGSLFGCFLQMLEDLPTKEDLVRLLKALKTYGARLHMWSVHVFPWHLGMNMAQLTERRARELETETTAGA